MIRNSRDNSSTVIINKSGKGSVTIFLSLLLSVGVSDNLEGVEFSKPYEFWLWTVSQLPGAERR